MLFSDLCLLSGSWLLVTRWHAARIHLLRFHCLCLDSATWECEMCLAKLNLLYQASFSSAVILWKLHCWEESSVIPHTTFQKKLKQVCYVCFPTHNTPQFLERDDLGQLPQVNILGTQPCWQLVSNSRSTSWGPRTCLYHPHRATL